MQVAGVAQVHCNVVCLNEDELGVGVARCSR